MRAPSASPSPRAATIGRMAFSDCMTRRSLPRSLARPGPSRRRRRFRWCRCLDAHLLVDAWTSHAGAVGLDDEGANARVVSRRRITGLGETTNQSAASRPRSNTSCRSARSQNHLRGPPSAYLRRPNRRPVPKDRTPRGGFPSRCREVALFLFFGARDHDRSRRQSGEEEHQTEHVGVLGDLFNGDRQAHDAGPRTAVLRRNAQTEQIGLAELVEEVLRYSPVVSISRARGLILS